MKDCHINIFYSEEDAGILQTYQILKLAPRLETHLRRHLNWLK
jgi:hypothetical protein